MCDEESDYEYSDEELQCAEEADVIDANRVLSRLMINVQLDKLKPFAKLYVDDDSDIGKKIAALSESSPCDPCQPVSHLLGTIIEQEVHSSNQLMMLDMWLEHIHMSSIIETGLLCDLLTFYFSRQSESPTEFQRVHKLIGFLINGISLSVSSATVGQLLYDQKLTSSLPKWSSILCAGRPKDLHTEQIKMFWILLQACTKACIGTTTESSTMFSQIYWATSTIIAWRFSSQTWDWETLSFGQKDLLLIQQSGNSMLELLLLKNMEDSSICDLVEITFEHYLTYGTPTRPIALSNLDGLSEPHSMKAIVATYILRCQGSGDDPARAAVLVKRLAALGLRNSTIKLPLWLSVSLARCALTDLSAFKTFQRWFENSGEILKCFRGLVMIGILTLSKEGPPSDLTFVYDEPPLMLSIELESIVTTPPDEAESIFGSEILQPHDRLMKLLVDTFTDVNVLRNDVLGESAAFLAYIRSLQHANAFVEARRILKRSFDFALSHIRECLQRAIRPVWLFLVRHDANFMAISTSLHLPHEPRTTELRILWVEFTILVDIISAGGIFRTDTVPFRLKTTIAWREQDTIKQMLERPTFSLGILHNLVSSCGTRLLPSVIIDVLPILTLSVVDENTDDGTEVSRETLTTDANTGMTGPTCGPLDLLYQILFVAGPYSSVGLAILRGFAIAILSRIRKDRPLLTRSEKSGLLLLPDLDVLLWDVLKFGSSETDDRLYRLGNVPLLAFLLANLDSSQHDDAAVHRHRVLTLQSSLLWSFSMEAEAHSLEQALSGFQSIDVTGDIVRVHAVTLSKNLLTVMSQLRLDASIPFATNCGLILRYIDKGITDEVSDPAFLNEMKRAILAHVRSLSVETPPGMETVRHIIFQNFEEPFRLLFSLAVYSDMDFEDFISSCFSFWREPSRLEYVREKHRLVRCARVLIHGTANKKSAGPARMLHEFPLCDNGGYFKEIFVRYLAF